MRHTGAIVSSAAAVLLVGLLLVAYLFESAGDLALYYGFGVISPLLAGVFVVGVVAVFVLDRVGTLSAPAATGIALGLGVVAFGIVLYWAVAGRVDVFRAQGWAFPLQRWLLVGLAAAVVGGAGLRAFRLRDSAAD